MPSRRLTPRTALDVRMSSVLTRNIRATAPEPVITELRVLAGDDHELLREVAGLAVGYYRDEYSETLCAALEAEIDGLGPWIELGRRRRSRGVHGGPEQRRQLVCRLFEPRHHEATVVSLLPVGKGTDTAIGPRGEGWRRDAQTAGGGANGERTRECRIFRYVTRSTSQLLSITRRWRTVLHPVSRLPCADTVAENRDTCGGPMLDRQLQTDKLYSGIVTSLGDDVPQAVGTLTFKQDQGLLLEVPYAFATAHDRQQFRAPADWFDHREMPDAVLFRGEDINVTLYGCRFASGTRAYGRGVAVGRMVADYAVLFNRSLSEPFAIQTVRSQMDGLRRWTDYSGALVEHELDDNNLAQSMSITMRGTTDLTWSHAGATMTLGTYWEGRDGDKGPGVREWVTVSSTFEDGALPDRHIAAQEVLRDLMILSFGTPIRFRRHAASDPSMPSDVRRTQVTAPPFRDLIVRETEDEFFLPVVPTARQPILWARDISAESLEAWSLLRAEWSRAIDPLILLLNRDIFAVEDIILQANISLEAAGHLLPPVEGEEATCRGGKTPTTATRVLRALRELTVPWDQLKAPEIGVARLIANTYNSIKHFDRTVLTDKDHLRLVANVSQLSARLVVLAQLPESAGFIERFCARDLARVVNQFQASGVLITEDGTLVPRPLVIRDGDRR